MSEMMMELRDHPHGGNGVAPKRQPVCLLLGGGMAAGKSTVREIIGRDIFWSKVPSRQFRSGCVAANSPWFFTVHAPSDLCDTAPGMLAVEHGAAATSMSAMLCCAPYKPAACRAACIGSNLGALQNIASP